MRFPSHTAARFACVHTQVYVEVSIGFVVALLGVIMLAGKLEPIHVADVVERSYDVLNTRADFARYDHRGQAFAALRAKHGVK